MEPLAQQPALIDQVYEKLLAAITAGEIQPGERLAQEKLAARLGVSRQPVSHALAMLKKQGLLTELGRKGLQVAPLDAERVRAFYQLRVALDGLAAQLAARRAAKLSDHERDRLQAVLSEGRAALMANAVADLVAADAAFHRQLYQLSGNSVVVETAAQSWPHLRRALSVALGRAPASPRVWEEHAEIADAVLSGNAAQAKSLAEVHAARAGNEIWQRLQDAGAVSGTSPQVSGER
ncbi:GntR family transcriptional regulator [Fodinicurvata fenggangensis]|uniref:GntR family transcriptional regulator n=1 Tax=Fodinicurvata fenggangensis TaxID=1121830 RepID=UPI00047C0CBA|nr:GntR family transcriptional regulator [Fodinicurvata fenggangensis]